MGKSTISMAIFHCYVSSSEGKVALEMFVVDDLASKEPAAGSRRGLWAQRAGHSTGCVAFAPCRASLWAEACDRKPRNPADVQLDLSWNPYEIQMKSIWNPDEIQMKSIEWMENDGKWWKSIGIPKKQLLNPRVKRSVIKYGESPGLHGLSDQSRINPSKTPLLSRGPGARVR